MWDGAAVRKVVRAEMAPETLRADGGTIIAGGNGPVKGILIALVMPVTYTVV